MTKNELLKLINQEWAAFIGVLGQVPPAAFDSAAAEGWSAKDIAGHVTTWEEDSLRAALKWAQGAEHQPLNADPNWSVDAWNAEQIAAKRNEPLALALTELGATHTRLMSLLAMLPEAVLGEGDRMEKLHGDTWHHYREHRLALEAWLSEGQATG